MTNEDLDSIALTLQLAATTTLLLLLLATPLAWWLAHSRHPLRRAVAALVALPLVLPPTVLGFYLLLLMSPSGWLGQLMHAIGGTSLAFSFEGLVLASLIYSLPFAVLPLRTAFTAIPPTLLDAATTLGAGPWDRFRSIVLPLSRSGIGTAAVLTFAHTVGEFGVVLMVGGSIPGETRVLSIRIYEQVEALNYAGAHWLSAGLVAASFVALLLIRPSRHQGHDGGAHA